MWLREYNEERPHDSLGDMTPREYLLTQTPEVSTYGPKLGRVTEGLPESCEQKTCTGKAGSKFSESTNIGTLEMCISLATAPYYLTIYSVDTVTILTKSGEIGVNLALPDATRTFAGPKPLQLLDKHRRTERMARKDFYEITVMSFM